MKNQALFSSKDKSKKLKCHLLQFLLGALRVNGLEQALKLDIVSVSKTSNFDFVQASCRKLKLWGCAYEKHPMYKMLKPNLANGFAYGPSMFTYLIT